MVAEDADGSSAAIFSRQPFPDLVHVCTGHVFYVMGPFAIFFTPGFQFLSILDGYFFFSDKARIDILGFLVSGDVAGEVKEEFIFILVLAGGVSEVADVPDFKAGRGDDEAGGFFVCRRDLVFCFSDGFVSFDVEVGVDKADGEVGGGEFVFFFFLDEAMHHGLRVCFVAGDESDLGVSAFEVGEVEFLCFVVFVSFGGDEEDSFHAAFAGVSLFGPVAFFSYHRMSPPSISGMAPKRPRR